MSWQDQGRQEHGWFGNGTAPKRAKDIGDDEAGLFARDGLSRRIAAVVYGAMAALPKALRGRVAAQHDTAVLEQLTELMTAWSRGATLGQARYAELFFGRSADDPVAVKLRGAALGAATARSHAELREAAENLAEAMQTIGLDRWRRFLAEAQDRARDLATVGAVRMSASIADPRKDAIRPVYPIETLLGIGAGIAGGAGAALRAAGGAIVRQFMPESGLPSDNKTGNAGARNGGAERSGNTTIAQEPKPSAANSPSPIARPAISGQKQDGHIRGTPQNRNRMKQGTPTSTFDGDAVQADALTDALTQEAREKGTPVPKQPGVREYDFGRRIGEGPNGRGQSIVRVHQDSAGRIHGHPSGQELP